LLHLFLLADIIQKEAQYQCVKRPGDLMSESTRKAVASPVGQLAEATETKTPPGPGDQIEVLVNGIRVKVSPELEAAVHRALKELNPKLPREMTTTQAAAFLDVSRPFVIKLIKRGELPCRMVGSHRRIPSDALLEYREKMYQQAKSAADEMAQTAQKLGLDELEGPPPKAQ
jgi:excisionase family DNA binding protein